MPCPVPRPCRRSDVLRVVVDTRAGDEGLRGGYVALQTVRNAFIVVATERSEPLHGAFVRIFAWNAFTYLHIPIVAGILVAAVADEIVIAHPGDELSTDAVLVLVGGPALYLLGHIAFRLRMLRTVSAERSLAVAALGAVGALAAASAVSALTVWTLVLVILVTVAAVETARRGTPPPTGQDGGMTAERLP